MGFSDFSNHSVVTLSAYQTISTRVNLTTQENKMGGLFARNGISLTSYF